MEYILCPGSVGIGERGGKKDYLRKSQPGISQPVNISYRITIRMLLKWMPVGTWFVLSFEMSLSAQRKVVNISNPELFSLVIIR